MKLAAARITPLRVPLRAPLATAHGLLEAREGALVELEAHGGARGCGEALPLPGFGLEQPESATRALAAACQRLVGGEYAAPGDALAHVETELAQTPAARAALETALLDLAAHETAVPLAVLLAQNGAAGVRDRIDTGHLLTAEHCEDAARQARELCAAGYRTLKLKLGTRSFADECGRAAAVRAAAGPDVALRVDANGAWSEAEAIRNLGALAELGIELLEQPVAADQLESLARVRRAAPFAIAADEAVRDETSAEHVLALGAADVLVLKPAALGGPGAALRIAARAREAGAGVLVTSFLDTAIGRSMALHVAAAVPDSGYAAGLATGSLLAEDLAQTAEPRGGALGVPVNPGLGVAPQQASLERLAAAPAREFRA